MVWKAVPSSRLPRRCRLRRRHLNVDLTTALVIDVSHKGEQVTKTRTGLGVLFSSFSFPSLSLFFISLRCSLLPWRWRLSVFCMHTQRLGLHSLLGWWWSVYKNGRRVDIFLFPETTKEQAMPERQTSATVVSLLFFFLLILILRRMFIWC